MIIALENWKKIDAINLIGALMLQFKIMIQVFYNPT